MDIQIQGRYSCLQNKNVILVCLHASLVVDTMLEHLWQNHILVRTVVYCIKALVESIKNHSCDFVQLPEACNYDRPFKTVCISEAMLRICTVCLKGVLKWNKKLIHYRSFVCRHTFRAFLLNSSLCERCRKSLDMSVHLYCSAPSQGTWHQPIVLGGPTSPQVALMGQSFRGPYSPIELKCFL